MGKQGISTIQNVRNCVFLVRLKRDFGIHAAERNMISPVFPRPQRIKLPVILFRKRLPSDGVFPYPALKCFPQCLLLLLSKRRFFAVQNSLFFSLGIYNGIVDTHIPQIQTVLQNSVCIGTLRPVGGVSGDVILRYSGFPGNIPFRSKSGILHLNAASQPNRRGEQLHQKLLDILLVNPSRAQTCVDLSSRQILWLCLLQCLYVPCKLRLQFRHSLGQCFGHTQLTPHIARQIFFRGHKGHGLQINKGFGNFGCFLRASHIPENNALQLLFQLRLTSAGQVGHICHIHTGFLRYGNRQRIRSAICCLNGLRSANCPLCKNICFAGHISVFIHIFKGSKQIIAAVL